MHGGIWVLNIFAAVWAAAAILVSHQPGWLVAFPIALSAALLVWASRQQFPARDPAIEARIGRVVSIWSAVEGVAMFLAANILINLHLSGLLMPVFAVIVGLHFLPLARGFPAPLYYATGAALILAGLAAMMLPEPIRPLATGLAAAIILWISAILDVNRAR